MDIKNHILNEVKDAIQNSVMPVYKATAGYRMILEHNITFS